MVLKKSYGDLTETEAFLVREYEAYCKCAKRDTSLWEFAFTEACRIYKVLLQRGVIE